MSDFSLSLINLSLHPLMADIMIDLFESDLHRIEHQNILSHDPGVGYK